MAPRAYWPSLHHESHLDIAALELEYRGYITPPSPPKLHWWSERAVQNITKPADSAGLILEAWSQGFMVGSLIIMAAITVANMRKGVLLHKLILLELILGTFHGTFIFANPPAYGWYLSVTAIFLNTSWSIHNVIAWLKTRPFLSKGWSRFYIATVILAQPYWILEIYANFTYFNNINDLFVYTRPYEAIFRDPWWIFSTANLFYNIITTYHLSLFTVVRLSPRFGVLLCAMCLSIAFIIVDIVSVTGVLKNALPDGLNPFWKMAFVFKCLTDSIVLDDFKTALDKLMAYKLSRERGGGTMDATVGSGSFVGDLKPWSTADSSPRRQEDAQRESFIRAADDPLADVDDARAGNMKMNGEMTIQQVLGAERVGADASRGHSHVKSTSSAQHWDDLPDFDTDRV